MARKVLLPTPWQPGFRSIDGTDLIDEFTKCEQNFIELYAASGSLTTIARGTLASPSIRFGDLTSGHWSPAANRLAGSISGVLAYTLGQDNNTGFGVGAGDHITSGTQNVAVGTSALTGCTTGGSNVAIGHGCMIGVVTGTLNTCVGQAAGALISSGAANTAIGRAALSLASTTSSHVAVGAGALQNCNAAQANTAVGTNSARALTTGQRNVAIGYQAMWFATDASNCIAIGDNAMASYVTGGAFANSGVAIGTNSQALLTSGSENVAVGLSSLAVATSSNMCAAIGVQSMQAVTTSDQCAALGTSSLGAMTTGDNNSGIGHGCGYSTLGGSLVEAITTAAQCTFLGAFATPGDATQRDYVTVVGADARGALFANSVTLGRLATDVIYSGLSVLGARTTGNAGYTVATLPVASAALAGARAYVTDATAPTFLGALVGGGAVVCPVFCNGSAWVSA